MMTVKTLGRLTFAQMFFGKIKKFTSPNLTYKQTSLHEITARPTDYFVSPIDVIRIQSWTKSWR